MNNIVSQKGTGACVLLESATTARSTNMFFAASGNLGITLIAGERNQDPGFPVNPVPPSNIEGFRLLQPVPGTNLSSYYSDDADGTIRASWDIGAFEYSAGSVLPEKPHGLRIKGS